MEITRSQVYTWGLLTLSAILLAGDMAARHVRADPPAGVPQSLAAQEFRLTDAQGHTRATLGAKPDGSTSLTFVDKDGKRRASLGITDAGEASVAFYDAAGKTRADLALLPDGNMGLLLLDKNEKPRLSTRLRADGTPVLTLSDDERQDPRRPGRPRRQQREPVPEKQGGGNDSIGLVVLPTDSPLAILKDKAGKTVWGASDN